MAIQAISDVWEFSKAKGATLLVLLALADRARKEDGVCWPGIAALAEQARLGERDVQYHLRKLIAMGEIVRTHKGGRGPTDTAIYQLRVGRYESVNLVTHKSETGFTGKSAKEGFKGAKRGPIRVQNPAYRTKRDPSIDPAGVPPTQTELDPSTGRLRIARGMSGTA